MAAAASVYYSVWAFTLAALRTNNPRGTRKLRRRRPNLFFEAGLVLVTEAFEVSRLPPILASFDGSILVIVVVVHRATSRSNPMPIRVCLFSYESGRPRLVLISTTSLF